MHPLVMLAANATREDKRYVCFVGAGLSKDAGLPTAWDLVLETAKLLRAHEDGDPTDGDTQTWFLNSAYRDLTYSGLIGRIHETTTAQQEFMRKVLHADQPGKPHRLLARLAKEGVIRCVITTNFDDLTERACAELGIEVEVVTEENLATAAPLIQCKVFRIYKPHGTIGASRLRNTPKDLERLDSAMEEELVRVINDHGLMILGYAAEDPGIQAVFRRKQRLLYPTFWVNPSEPPSHVQEIFGLEPLNFLPCVGASAFIEDLMGMYRKLDLMAPTGGLGSLAKMAEDAIRAGSKDVRAKISAFWDRLEGEFKAVAPDLGRGPDVAGFRTALEKAVPACAAFSRVANTAAEMADSQAVTALFKGIEKVLAGYYLPPGVGGSFSLFEFDYYKFLGHELLVCLCAPLVRDDQWVILGDLLDNRLHTRNSPLQPNEAMLPFYAVSQQLLILDLQRWENNAARQGSLLYERHTHGELAQSVPIESFAAADFFLYLRWMGDADPSSDDKLFMWSPFSSCAFRRVPSFLIRAQSRPEAERLANALRINYDVDLLKLMCKAKSEAPEGMNLLYISPLAAFDPSTIGKYAPKQNMFKE